MDSLPDPILCHVLSFLPIHYSVQTSVLARRWRFLWTSVPNLDFEEEEQFYHGSQRENRIVFSDIVTRVMLKHNGPIDSFRLRPSYRYYNNTIGQYQIDAWIGTAIARHVQVLHLFNLYDNDVELPQCCFTCETLVELTIQNCTISPQPGAVCLPKLKQLKLISNYYQDDHDSITYLVSGCLAIENLFIERHMTGCSLCYICSPTLKSLVLMCYAANLDGDHEHTLVLDIPSIQYLRLYDDISCIILVEKLSSLVVADIWLSNDFLSQVKESISRSMYPFGFLQKFSDTNGLTFRSSARMKLLDPTSSVDATTKFHYLTELVLEADWHILSGLLGSACNLELLTIKQVKDKAENKHNSWREPRHLPECLSSSLKYVNVFEFEGGEQELNMVKYILRHAKVLKTIKIYSLSCGKDSKLNMLQQISYFPRGSEKCRLTFV